MIVKNKYATFVGYEFASKFGLHAQKWTAPDAASAVSVLAATALTSAAQTITTFVAQPDFPRLVTITGNQTQAKSVVVNGTDIRGNAISDTIVLNNTSTVPSVKAFKTISSIVLPALTGSGDTVSVGISAKLGLEMIPAYAVAVSAHHNGTLEGTLPTITLGSATDISKDVISFSSAPGGDHDEVVAFYTADQTGRASRTA